MRKKEKTTAFLRKSKNPTALSSVARDCGIVLSPNPCAPYASRDKQGSTETPFFGI